MKNVRTIITMMTMVSACIIFAACGKVEETHNQVVNTTEKAAATATAESKETEVTVDTTTTTTVTTTAEPETTTEPATAEVVTTIAEPEPEPDTDTEAATTGTEPDTETETETEATTTEAPADGMYTVADGFKRKAEELSGQKVVEFEWFNDEGVPVIAVLEDGNKAMLALPNKDFDMESTYSIECFNGEITEGRKYEYAIEFSIP